VIPVEIVLVNIEAIYLVTPIVFLTTTPCLIDVEVECREYYKDWEADPETRSAFGSLTTLIPICNSHAARVI
jgi:hypothetical protein